MEAIPALCPRDGDGHQFVLYADSTSGEPGGPHEARHAQVTATVRRLHPEPEFIAFPGDAVMRGNDAAQWEHWLGHEMQWCAGKHTVYQSTSNHNTFDAESVALFRRYWNRLPGNGPEGQEGLAYHVRRGDLLYVSMHQPEPTGARGPDVRVDDIAWLDRVLTEHADATYVFVAGHYPAFPVNGYTEAPTWCLPRDRRTRLWRTLTAHGVTAYLCSHVIAFDVQVHDGIPQITSGGGGTDYGPGGFMPGPTEYLHAVQIAVDRQGLRYQVLDTTGTRRECLSWPLPEPEPTAWHEADQVSPDDAAILVVSVGEKGTPSLPRPTPWLADADDRFWFGIDVQTGRFAVDLRLGGEMRRWRGPIASMPARIDLAFHPGMGPGGILWRWNEKGPWTSMSTASPHGLEAYEWPETITLRSETFEMRYAVSRLEPVDGAQSW